MKVIKLCIYTIVLTLSFQVAASAQSTSVTKVIKKHFNETVEKVENTNDVDEKRAILDNSFNKMITAINTIESVAHLSEENTTNLNSFKNKIIDNRNELNGLDNYDRVPDEDLDDFSNYSQQFIEQADRTITISVTTVLLIIIILLLL